MGWTCQHDQAGFCKLLKKPCVPGIKGCILNKSEYTFSSGNFEQDKEALKKQNTEDIDWAKLAKSN